MKPQTMQTRRVPPLALMGSSFVDFRFLFFKFFSFGWEKCFAFRGREEEEPRDTREKKKNNKGRGKPPELDFEKTKKKTKQNKNATNKTMGTKTDANRVAATLIHVRCKTG